jgi:hypothetical protein
MLFFYCLVIKCNLGSLLAHVNIFEKRAICSVLLLLDGSSELHQVFGYGLPGSLENIDQSAYCVSN